MFDDIINNAIESARKRGIEIHNGDYIGKNKQGIEVLYCGKCHKPRESVLIYLDNKLFVPSICDCDIERKKQEEFRHKIYNLKRHCYPNPQLANNLLKLSFTTAKNNELIKCGKEYVEIFPDAENKGLIFCGVSGAGKTYAMICTVNALLNKGYSVRWYRASDLLYELTDKYNKKDKETYSRLLYQNSILCIDDLNISTISDKEAEILFDFIDVKLLQKTPILITSNLSKNAFKNAESKNKRLLTRLYSSCYIKECNNRNYRIEN